MKNRNESRAKATEFGTSVEDLLNRSKWIKRFPGNALGHKVVAATVEEFAEKGVQGARVAEICRRAGTTDPTFYRYFWGLRQAALFIISEYYWLPLNEQLNQPAEIADDPQKLFEAVVTLLIQSANDDPERPWLAESKVFQIVVAESRNPLLLLDLALDSEYIKFLAALEDIIKAGQRHKYFKVSLRPALLASLLVNSLHGLLAQNRVRYLPFHVEEDEVRRVAANVVGMEI